MREGILTSCSIQHGLVLEVIVPGHYWEQGGLIDSVAACILSLQKLPLVPSAQQAAGGWPARRPVGFGHSARSAEGLGKV